MDATTQFSVGEAARVLQVSDARVRTLARLGGIVLDPGADGASEFTFQQLLILRTTHGLLEAGVPSRRVRHLWTSLRRQLAGNLPLTSIRIFADGDRAIAWDGQARWQPDSGQFLLDFGAAEIAARAEAEAEPAAFTARAEVEPSEVATSAAIKRPERTPLTLAMPAATTATVETEEALPDTATLTAEQWFQIGSELESTSPVEARRAYEQALEADPAMADAHLNLGRLDHDAGELGKAEAHYRDAVRCAPDDATCHYNLGVLLEDRGRPDEAVLAYKQAIVRDPELADAHYNLGLLLESHGRRSEAMRHLMIARQLYDQASGAE